MGIETYGQDISSEGVKIAKQISPGSVIKIGCGEKLKFKGDFFDYVTNIGALEHFVDISKGLQEKLRVAKPNAKFCIVVPNKDYFFWKFGKKGTEQQEINERLLSLKGWARLFASEGFKVIAIHHDPWFKHMRIFNSYNPFVVMKRAILWSIWQMIPLKYTYQFVFIMKKK